MRAQRRYEQTVRVALVNVPTTFAQTADRVLPNVKLESLPQATREHLMRESRKEAEMWLEAENQRAKAAQQKLAVTAKLQDWYEQKEAVRQEEQERQAALEEEKERAEQQDKKRWKKRGASLQRRLANWAAEKAEKEEKEERAAAEAAQAKEEREKRRYQCYLDSQKKKLEEWYQEKGRQTEKTPTQPTSPPRTQTRKPKDTPRGQGQRA